MPVPRRRRRAAAAAATLREHRREQRDGWSAGGARRNAARRDREWRARGTHIGSTMYWMMAVLSCGCSAVSGDSLVMRTADERRCSRTRCRRSANAFREARPGVEQGRGEVSMDGHGPNAILWVILEPKKRGVFGSGTLSAHAPEEMSVEN